MKTERFFEGVSYKMLIAIVKEFTKLNPSAAMYEDEQKALTEILREVQIHLIQLPLRRNSVASKAIKRIEIEQKGFSFLEEAPLKSFILTIQHALKTDTYVPQYDSGLTSFERSAMETNFY